MIWYVSYGSGRSMHPGLSADGSGWALKQCGSEQIAIDYAIKCAKQGMIVQAVGKMGASIPPKYRHAQIVALMNGG
jgi:hypothetical protein